VEAGGRSVWTPRATPEPGLRIAFVADPDGNLVELLHCLSFRVSTPEFGFLIFTQPRRQRKGRGSFGFARVLPRRLRLGLVGCAFGRIALFVLTLPLGLPALPLSNAFCVLTSPFGLFALTLTLTLVLAVAVIAC